MSAPRDPRPAHDTSLQPLLAATRRELRDLPGFGREREEALVGRVLSATTGARPVRRSRRAWWLGFAAAVLLASAGALAWSTRGAATPGAELALAGVGEVPVPAERSALALEDVLAAARAELAASASAAPRTRAAGAVSADAPLELRLLEARARGLRERRWDPWLREVPLSEAGTLSLALWCDVQLDRYVLSGDRPPAWKQAVGILRRDLERPATQESSKLLAHALERARDYGLTDGVEVARLEPVRHLWSETWFDDLDAAGHEAGVAENGVWRAWVDWRGQ